MRSPSQIIRTTTLAAVLLAVLMLGAAGNASASTKVLKTGSEASAVKYLQKYLDRSRSGDFFDYDVQSYTTYFGAVTKTGLKQWQQAAGYRATGRIAVGGKQWRKLRHEATAYWRSTSTDARARSAARREGLALDASQEAGRLNVLRYNRKKGLRVIRTIRVSFGGMHYDKKLGANRLYPTENGVFRTFRRGGRNDYSRTFDHAPMPWSVYFNGGQAFHYDGLWPSHGCIHVPSMKFAKYLNDLPLNAVVVVH